MSRHHTARRGPLAVLAVAATLAATLIGLPPASGDTSGAAVHPVASASISSGGGHTCVVVGPPGGVGDVRCWGHNHYGQLGLGSTQAVGDDEHPAAHPPVDLGLGRQARTVAVGDHHACAVLDTGAVRCWGRNGYGQLGTGSTALIGDDEAPAAGPLVDLGAGRTALALAAGDNHTCAILDTGQVRCWGANAEGQLGLGHTDARGDNESVSYGPPVDLGPGRTAQRIAAGGTVTCAILDNGAVRCWGHNSSGQLGIGSTAALGDNESVATVPPIALGAGRTARAIAVGPTHVCAILDNHALRCWGSDDHGVLGAGSSPGAIGDNEPVTALPPVPLGGGRHAVAVSASDRNTCALLDDRTVRCWGDREYGQALGTDQALGDDELPTAVPPITLGRRAVAIDAGWGFACAVLDNARVRCWGYGYGGALGLATTSTVPAEEAGDHAPVSLGDDVRIDRQRSALSAAARPRRDRRAPYVFVVSGSLTGTLRPGACAGRVTVVVAGRALVQGTRSRVGVSARTRTSVTDECTYRARLTVRPVRHRFAQKKLVGRVTATASYDGGPLLKPSKASVRLRLG